VQQRRIRTYASGVRLRLGLLLAITAGACAVAGVAPAIGSAKVVHNPHGHFLGVLPSTLHHKTLTTATANGTPPLTYHGGPVVHSSKVYAIFWKPSGTYIPAGYQSQIAQYFTDVGADSWKTSNVYASLTQYCQGVTTGATSCTSASNNFSSYSVSYGGSYVDTAAYPTTGNCPNYTLGDFSTTTRCLSDTNIQAEVNKVVAAKGWARGLGTEFFVFTAPHVGQCQDTAGTACYDPEFSSGYCAYHSNISNTTLYAVQPWADISGCQYSTTNSPYPNDDGADPTINVVSHEHNETISDPLGTAWWDSNGYENGDECAWLALTTSYNGIGDYSQTIHGDQYLMQSEWSNRANDCVLKNTYPQPTASFTAAQAATPAHTINFTLTRSDSDDTAFRYAWNFGDGSTATTQNPAHTYAAAGARTVTVTVFDAHGDQAHVSKAVSVS
jgi:PKD domain